MKYFEIRSDLADKLYGVLIYNEKKDEYIVKVLKKES